MKSAGFHVKSAGFHEIHTEYMKSGSFHDHMKSAKWAKDPWSYFYLI